MPSAPRRVFAVLAWRLAAAGSAATILFSLPVLTAPSRSTAQPDTRPAASGPWLDRLNMWRASTGVGQLVENTTWSAGDQSHALYMVKNNVVTHYETPGVPYYTSAGDTAAKNSNIYVSSSTATTDAQAIDWWMGAPIHALGLMDPRLTTTGFGSYREVKAGWQMGAAVDVLRGNPFAGGTYPVYFPGNGTTEPLTSYSGHESPDPLQACPGYAVPTGLPVFIQVGGNIATTVGPVHSFTGNGVSLAHCVIDSHNAAIGTNLKYRGAVLLIPRQPLQNGVTYTVSLTVNNVPRTWSFTVGPFATCSVTATANPPSPSTAGGPVTLTASATGCASALYQFWMLPPNSATWQLVQPYSVDASFIWNTSALTGGVYRFSIWARGAASNGTFGNALGRWDGFASMSYALSFLPCASVSATSTVAASLVSLKASASACPNPQYEFWLLPAGSQTWLLARQYAAGDTFTWDSAGKPTGTYKFSVWARDAASPGMTSTTLGTWDASTMLDYRLALPCTAANASEMPSGAAPGGTAVAITASAVGCPNPLYEFFVMYPGTQTWLLAQAYSASPTYSWSTLGKPAGVYKYSIWARDASSAGTTNTALGSWDAYTTVTFTLTSASCATVTATSASSPGTVAVRGSASGCPNPLYEFWILPPGSQTWLLAHAYSSNATFTWNTVGKAKGQYEFSVWARDASSAGATSTILGKWDAYAMLAYTLS